MTLLSDRIPLSAVRDLLRTGHPLPFRVLDAQGRLLLNAGQMLVDDQFESLAERGAWAERPLVEAERAAQAAASSAKAAASALSLFDQWDRLLWQLDKLTRALVRCQTQGSEVRVYVKALQRLVDVDADAALFLCIRRDDRRFALYPLTHAMDCAVLATLAGRRLGWDAGAVESLCCSALTMNLSIQEHQATMAEQGEPPSPKQLREIRAHPEASAALLRACGVEDADWLSTVEAHHEQRGGGGYPRGLVEPGESAHLLRAIDVLMAKISPRAKRPAMAPQAAVRQLFQQAPSDSLAMAIIRTLGVYPPGSLVHLRSGEVAVAIRRPSSGTNPLVATLSDRQGRPSAATNQRDTSQPEFAVQGPLADAGSFPRVLPERVYGVIPA